MNPQAGAFRPQPSKAITQFTTSNSANQMALTNSNTAHSQANGHNEIQLDLFRAAMLDEICALRHDVDTIRHGAFPANIGPFQHATDAGSASAEALRTRVLDKLSLSELQAPLALTMTPQNGSAPSSFDILEPNKNGASTSTATVAGSTQTKGLGPSVTGSALPTRLKSNTPDIATLRPDTPVPSVEDPARNVVWQPSYIRDLPPAEDLVVPPPSKTVTFSWDFLQSTFCGIEWSPGLYHIPESSGDCLLPTRTYYAINATYEPYLPARPGAHGAKLTAFFNNVENTDGAAAYENVPLFVSAVKRGNSRFKDSEYIYFGTYSQTRWSDKLDYDHVRDCVPDEVKYYWAEQLADPSRPERVTKALMKQMVPMPEYEGILPTSAANGSLPVAEDDLKKQLDRDLKNFVKDLKYWEKDATLQIKLLKKENILEAFNNESLISPLLLFFLFMLMIYFQADADAVPGMRLWLEYFQCVGWDTKFYELLVKMQEKTKMKR